MSPLGSLFAPLLGALPWTFLFARVVVGKALLLVLDMDASSAELMDKRSARASSIWARRSASVSLTNAASAACARSFKACR